MNFNWTLFFEPVPYGSGIYLYWLWDGIIVTISLAATSWIIAFIVGSIIGVLRTVNNRFIKTLSKGYIEVFRNVPLLVQMFLWYMLFPEVLSGSLHVWFMQTLSPNAQSFILASMALGLFTSARIAEQVRTGLEALPSGQKQAAIALGLSGIQAYWYILLPNAYRKIIPTLTSEMTNIVKNSSVASTIGLIDLIGQIDRINENTNCIIEILCGVTLAFSFINYSVIRVMHLVEKKTRLKNVMGG